MGRVYSISNPHSSTGSTTDGTASFQYDALGEKTKQTNQDRSIVYWCYNGSATMGQPNCHSHIGAKSGLWVDYRDENLNQTQQTTDALGQLIYVIEPNGTSQLASMETDYSYDPLNNLTGVTQWGGVSGTAGARTRSFRYDNLSRLVQAYNPESGWTCYGTSSGAPNGSNCSEGYDGNGNLMYKTDARNIRMTYSYDAWNRLLQKSASDSSLSYSFTYDDNSRPNGIGHLFHSSNNINGATNYYYDPMGRVTDRYVCVPGNCSYGLGAWAHYDLSGQVIQSNLANGIFGLFVSFERCTDTARTLIEF